MYYLLLVMAGCQPADETESTPATPTELTQVVEDEPPPPDPWECFPERANCTQSELTAFFDDDGEVWEEKIFVERDFNDCGRTKVYRDLGYSPQTEYSSYDEYNRTTMIELDVDSDESIELTLRYFYEEGRQSGFSYTYADDSDLDSEYVISYNGDGQKSVIDKISGPSSPRQQVYTYDADGRLVEVVSYSGEITTWTYEEVSEGTLVTEYDWMTVESLSMYPTSDLTERAWYEEYYNSDGDGRRLYYEWEDGFVIKELGFEFDDLELGEEPDYETTYPLTCSGEPRRSNSPRPSPMVRMHDQPLGGLAVRSGVQ